MNEKILDKNKVLNLLVAFAFIDDELHPREIEALEKVCHDLGISEDDLDEMIGLYESHRGQCINDVGADKPMSQIRTHQTVSGSL